MVGSWSELVVARSRRGSVRGSPVKTSAPRSMRHGLAVGADQPARLHLDAAADRRLGERAGDREGVPAGLEVGDVVLDPHALPGLDHEVQDHGVQGALLGGPGQVLGGEEEVEHLAVEVQVAVQDPALHHHPTGQARRPLGLGREAQGEVAGEQDREAVVQAVGHAGEAGGEVGARLAVRAGEAHVAAVEPQTAAVDPPGAAGEGELDLRGLDAGGVGGGPEERGRGPARLHPGGEVAARPAGRRGRDREGALGPAALEPGVEQGSVDGPRAVQG